MNTEELLVIKKRLRIQSIFISILSILVLVLFFSTYMTQQQTVKASLSVSELKILDHNGTVRTIISGSVPDAIVNGKTLNRGTTAAGIILYDKDGQERSGYLTFDDGNNVALTLDSKESQQALFVAGPEGGVAARLWQGDHPIEMRADSGGARLTGTKSNDVTVQLPEVVTIPTEICELFKGGIKSEVPEGLPRHVVQDVCTKRFPTEACTPCLPEA